MTADTIALTSIALGRATFLFVNDYSDRQMGWVPVTLGVLSYSVVSPIIHLAHRNASRAALSVVVRGGLVFGGGFVGGAVASAFTEKCGSDLTHDQESACFDDNLDVIGRGALTGAFFGAIGATAIDALAFAHRYRVPTDGPTPNWVVVPVVDRERMALTLSARF